VEPVPRAEFRTSPRARILAFQKTLIDEGYVATIRKTRGDEHRRGVRVSSWARSRPHEADDPHPIRARRYALRLLSPSVPTMTPLLRTWRFAALLATLALGGLCVRAAGEPRAPRQPEPLPPPVKLQEATPKERAKLHADLGAGYYERGRMDIALEELNEAVKLDPEGCANLQPVRPRLRDARRERKGGAELPARARHGAAGLRHPSQLGLVSVQQRASARIDPEFDKALANPLYKTPRRADQAGRCSIASRRS
jgi:hypothetical protein